MSATQLAKLAQNPVGNLMSAGIIGAHHLVLRTARDAGPPAV